MHARYNSYSAERIFTGLSPLEFKTESSYVIYLGNEILDLDVITRKASF